MDGLPLLEHLVLEGAIVKDGDTMGSVTRRVEMGHLTHIELHEWIYVVQCAGLLDHLILPACRTLALMGTNSAMRTAKECHRVFFAVVSALGDRSALRACELRLLVGSVAVYLWQDTLPAFKYDDYRRGTDEDDDPSGRPQVTVRVGCGGTVIRSDVLPILVSALPLADVRTLRLLQANRGHSVRPLASLRNVETLLYLCDRPTELLQTLSKFQHDPRTLLLFPALRHLTLRQAQWRPNWRRSVERDSDVPLSELIDGMLLARGEMGAPLHELRLQGLRNLDVAEELGWLESARQDVSHFQWDTEDWGEEYWFRWLNH